jgi:uncharacterized membrane protein
VLFFFGLGSSLGQIILVKGCWVFFPSVEGFPRINFVYLVHGFVLVILAIYCSYYI